MKPSERYKAIEQAKADKQKFLADLAKNKQLAEMRQQELNHNYQMHKEGMALKNKELMQNLHTNYFNISSGAVKGVAENTKGDTTKENLYASIADNFSENNMGFLGKAFFKGLAIKERGQRETKEAEEKRKVYEDYLNKYGDVIQYLSATDKYAKDLMVRQQLKNQVEQEFVNLIDNVESRNLSPTKKDEVYTAFAKKASNILGEKMTYVGDVNGSGEKIITNEDGKMALVPNPHYLDQLERLNVPNTTQIDWSRQKQNQQQQSQDQQQMQQQQDPDYRNMEFKPNTAYTLPAEGGGTVTLTTDDEGNFGKGFQKIREDVYTKLYESGHIPDPKEDKIPKELETHLARNYLDAVKNIASNDKRIEKIDKLITISSESFLQGMPEGVANALKWFIPEEKAKLETMKGFNIHTLLEPLRAIMPGIWTDPDFLRMMEGAWSIDKTPKSVREIMEVVKQVSIEKMHMYKDAFEEGARFKNHLQNYEKNAKKFAPIFAKYDNQNDSQNQNNTQGQGVASGNISAQTSDDGNIITFSRG